MDMEIIIDDLSGGEIADFLTRHIEGMKSVSPPQSKHALDLKGLRQPDITFWSVYDGNRLIACGALKELDSTRGEIKSMRTDPTVRGKGTASRLLDHIISVAKFRQLAPPLTGDNLYNFKTQRHRSKSLEVTIVKYHVKTITDLRE